MKRIHESQKFLASKNTHDPCEFSSPPGSLYLQDSGPRASTRKWEGKNFDRMPDVVDSFEEIGSTSFSGVSHPPEPVDTDFMRPVCVPRGPSTTSGPFLEDLSIRVSDDRDAEKDVVWDTSLPPSPHSCCTSDDRNDESVGRASGGSSGLSGGSSDSNWTSGTTGPGLANKPHRANDPRWKAVLAVRARYGALGMGHFRLTRLLGSGDIGGVYQSELSGTRCYFAMKVIDKGSLAGRKKLSRGQTEREILQRLDHPFLPTLYADFETDRFLCLVMEYCPGGDLHTLRQRQPGRHFSEYAARFYAAEVLLAIEYLHMLGVVYRDLKPENVLVREDGHIMLSDFDLSLRCTVSPTLVKSDSVPSKQAGFEPASVCVQPACFLPRIFSKTKTKTTRTGPTHPELVAEPVSARSMSFVGTHEYLAPEIVKGEGHGSAVDWWTFGVFLYELLYGRTPFKGGGNRATLFNVVGQPVRFPDLPATSYASRDLIRGLLVKEPQHRLGVKRGATEIKQHPFFESVNWALIRCGTPPEVPGPASGGSGWKMEETEVKSSGKYLDFEFF